MTGYWDIVIVMAIAGVMLWILDYRIKLAFLGHEARERQLIAELQLTGDGAAGAAREASRHVRELRAEQTLHKVSLDNLSVEVREHGKRLGSLEERFTRAALAVPHSHRREDDPP
jgi:hypothetical protein